MQITIELALCGFNNCLSDYEWTSDKTLHGLTLLHFPCLDLLKIINKLNHKLLSKPTRNHQIKKNIILNTTPGLHYKLIFLVIVLRNFLHNHLLTPFWPNLELFQKQIINFFTLLVLLILWQMSLEWTSKRCVL